MHIWELDQHQVRARLTAVGKLPRFVNVHDCDGEELVAGLSVDVDETEMCWRDVVSVTMTDVNFARVDSVHSFFSLRFCNFSQLHTLMLSRCELSDEGIAIVLETLSERRCRRLRYVDVGENPFSDCTPLAKFLRDQRVATKTLNLTGCNNVHHDGLELVLRALADNRWLRTLRADRLPAYGEGGDRLEAVLDAHVMPHNMTVTEVHLGNLSPALLERWMTHNRVHRFQRHAPLQQMCFVAAVRASLDTSALPNIVAANLRGWACRYAHMGALLSTEKS
jgi:hypothetical protein